MISLDNIDDLRQRSDRHLESALKKHYRTIEKVSPKLVESIAYSINSGGKRIRPLLVYASTQASGGNLWLADDIAAAIEMIHTYSLIHDDLPSMDDDTIRRGQPSCHVEYGEAMAILAGDALQALAFYELTTTLGSTRDSEQALSIMEIIGKASIAMVSGQALDICSINSIIDEETLQTMHMNKTGALISASVQVGGYCADNASDKEQLDCLHTIGDLIGLAFQIQDDLLDLEQEVQNSDTPDESDATQNKPTYPAVIGIEASKQLVKSLHCKVMEYMPALNGDCMLLTQMCDLLGKRSN